MSMFPLQKGKHAKQAHVGLPEGTYEQEHGREAFTGAASHLYRTHPPTGWTRIEGPLRPRAYRITELVCADQTDSRSFPTECLFNDELHYFVSRRQESSRCFFRNADGDELYFIHQGQGIFETDFGHIPFSRGDYVVIPKGTTYRILVESRDNFFVVVETAGLIAPPEKGLLGQHALYDPAVLRVPELHPVHEKGEWEVRVKRGGTLTSIYYPFHLSDVVGWKGDLTAWALNVRDIRPVVGPRGHLPPSVHTTFVSEGMNVQTFVPRPLEEDPECVKVPFYHKNIDFDEVLFYHDGEFFSRSGIRAGMMTLHPYGIDHGPQPAAIRASASKTRTEEVAVLLEAKKPLQLSPALEAVEWKEYHMTWKED